MRALLLTSATGGLLALTGVLSPALADCEPVGTTVTCAADDTDGFKSDESGLTITIDSGVTVTGPGKVIDVTNDITFTNNGTATGAGGDVVEADNGFTGTNNGTISSTAPIADERKAVQFGNDGSFTNAAGASVTSNEEGIDAGDRATITNEGTITSFDRSIDAGADAVILNTGTINDDVLNPAELAIILNTGTMTSLAGDVIDVDSGTITNEGTMLTRSDDEAAIDFDASLYDATIANEAGAVIEGGTGIMVELGGGEDPANLRGQHVTNAGRITGRAGTALNLGAGEDSLTLLDGGVIEGVADFGADADRFVMDGTMGTIVGQALIPGAPVAFVATFGVPAAPMPFFNGGAGQDTVVFDALVTLADILGISAFDDGTNAGLALDFRNGSGSASQLRFIDFERFEIAGGLYRIDNGELTPVPLPASLPLMAAVMGVLGWGARRRARRVTGQPG
jgi:fibronectin-binding autotransporter adhesin